MKCLVASCKNTGRHKIPQNEDLKKQWIEAIKHIKPGRTINARTTICSDHFLKTDFSVIPSYWNNYYMGRKKLKKTVVPSVFPWTMNTPVEEPPPVTIEDTVTFNADRVKATYSRDKPACQQTNKVRVNKQSYAKTKTQCVIPNCGNKGRHKFPKDEARRKQWIQAIKHLKPKLTINANSLICSDHFRLSVFPWNETDMEVTLEEPSSPEVKLEQPSPIQIKLEHPSSPHQVKLEPSLIAFQVKVEAPSSPVQVKLELTQDEIEQPSSSPTKFEEQWPSSIQDKLSSNPDQVNVTNFRDTGRILKKIVVPSVFAWNKTSVADQQEQQPSIQDAVSFNPNTVKATYTRVLPTEFVEEQNNVVSTYTEDSSEDPLQ